MIGNSDDKINFPHELLLTKRQVANLRKAFENNSSTDIKLSKTQLSKMIQSGGFFGRLFGPLLKTGLPFETTALIISNNEMEGIFRIVTSLGNYVFTIQNEIKWQKGGFLSMFLGTLGASLLGVLAGKEMNVAGEGFIRAGYGYSLKDKDS